jgi:hypothetical protein
MHGPTKGITALDTNKLIALERTGGQARQRTIGSTGRQQDGICGVSPWLELRKVNTCFKSALKNSLALRM